MLPVFLGGAALACAIGSLFVENKRHTDVNESSTYSPKVVKTNGELQQGDLSVPCTVRYSTGGERVRVYGQNLFQVLANQEIASVANPISGSPEVGYDCTLAERATFTKR